MKGYNDSNGFRRVFTSGRLGFRRHFVDQIKINVERGGEVRGEFR